MQKKKNILEIIFYFLINTFKNLRTDNKFFLLYVFFVIIFVLFLPIVNISSIWESVWWMYFIWDQLLFKTFIIILLSLSILFLRNIIPNFRNFASQIIWFRENPNIINFVVLWIIFAIYLNIWDFIKLTMIVSDRIKLTKTYRFMLMFLIVWMLYTLYNILTVAKSFNNKKNIYHHSEKSELNDFDNNEISGLFGKIKWEKSI